MAKNRWGDELRGMRVNDLLDMPQEVVGAMSRSELSRVVSRLSSAANKRLNRLANYYEGRGDDLSADYMRRERFGAKGKTVNQLRSELARLRGFFERKSSSVTGVKQIERDFLKRVSERGGYSPEHFTSAQLSRFWHAYTRAKEMGLFAGVFGNSDDAQKAVFQEWAKDPEQSVDDFISAFAGKMEDEYQRIFKPLDDDSDVSSFFRL